MVSMRKTAAALALAVALPAAVRANPETTPQILYGANTLKAGELELGIWRFDVGATDNFTLGTLPLFWIARLKNLEVKYRVYSWDESSIALSAGALWVNAQDWDKSKPDATFYMIPLQLAYTRRMDLADLLHVALSYTATGIKGSFGDEDTALNGVAVVDTLVLNPTWERRISESFSILLDANMLLAERARANPAVTTKLGDYDSVDMHVSGKADLKAGFKGNVVASAFWSWDTFNLRVGLGYGHLEAPVAHIFADKPSLVPDFDFYWRF